MNTQITDMLQQGIIVPSTSAWASPALLVPKKEGTWRFVVDYRKLNKVTEPSSYPLPVINDILSDISETTYMTTLDLTAGYWQVAVHPKDIDKLSFVVPQGQYTFNRMPFGVSGAPSTFQRLMNTVLEPVLGHNVHVYLDDVIITNATFEEHVTLLQQVFELLKAAGLTLKLSKCSFARDEIPYLGFKLTREGLETDDEKVRPIIDFPQPTTAKQLSRFLGMCSWYQHFIPNYATVCEPLYALRRKYKKFLWTPDAQEAFVHLKTLLSSPPILQLPEFSQPFQLYTDASGVGLGAVLCQADHPIAYASRTLSPTERRYSATEIECLSILYALNKFRIYLNHLPIEIITDHSALTHLQTAKHLSTRLFKWALKLQEFNFHVTFRPGKLQQLPDALSRQPLPNTDDTLPQEELYTLLLLNEITSRDQLIQEQQTDPEFGPLYAYIAGTQVSEQPESSILRSQAKYFEIIDGILFYTRNCTTRGEYRAVIPRSLRLALLSEYHDIPLSGHLGIRKTCHKISECGYWPSLRQSVRIYINSCDICQRTKFNHTSPAGKMISSTVNNVYSCLGIDLMGPYPLTAKMKNRYILVITDYFSKWIELFPLRNSAAHTITECLVNNVICRYGAPSSIVSDNGPQFISDIFKDMCEQLQIQHIRTTPYHPQSNMTERVNRNIGRMISAYIGQYHNDWDTFLQQFAFAIRTAVHQSTSVTPAELFLGRKILTPFHRLLQFNTDFNYPEHIQKLKDVLEKARTHIASAQLCQKRQYDKHRRNTDLVVGDHALLQTHFQSSSSDIIVKKFAPLYEGPFEVVKKHDNNVTLKKRDGTELRAHVDQCRKYNFRNIQQILSPKRTDTNASVSSKPTYVAPFTRADKRPHSSIVSERVEQKKPRVSSTLVPTPIEPPVPKAPGIPLSRPHGLPPFSTTKPSSTPTGHKVVSPPFSTVSTHTNELELESTTLTAPSLIPANSTIAAVPSTATLTATEEVPDNVSIIATCSDSVTDILSLPDDLICESFSSKSTSRTCVQHPALPTEPGTQGLAPGQMQSPVVPSPKSPIMTEPDASHRVPLSPTSVPAGSRSSPCPEVPVSQPRRRRPRRQMPMYPPGYRPWTLRSGLSEAPAYLPGKRPASSSIRTSRAAKFARAASFSR